MSKILFFIAIFFVSTKSAMAYVDPGIGALFAQGLIGIIAGVSLFFSKIRETLLRLLGMSKKDSSSNADKDNSQQSKKSKK